MRAVKVASDKKMRQAEPTPPQEHVKNILGHHSSSTGDGGEAERAGGSLSGPKITPDNYG